MDEDFFKQLRKYLHHRSVLVGDFNPYPLFTQVYHLFTNKEQLIGNEMFSGSLSYSGVQDPGGVRKASRRVQTLNFRISEFSLFKEKVNGR